MTTRQLDSNSYIRIKLNSEDEDGFFSEMDMKGSDAKGRPFDGLHCVHVV